MGSYLAQHVTTLYLKSSKFEVKNIKGLKIVYRDRFFEAKLMEKYFRLYFKHKIEKTF